METPEIDQSQTAGNSRWKRTVLKYGFWGAMAFFTIKGLVWLAVIAATTYFSCG